MKTLLVVTVVSVLLIVNISCAPKAVSAPTPVLVPTPKAVSPAPIAPAKARWEEDWDTALVKSKQEGKIVLTGSISPRVRQALSQAAIEKYGIGVEVISGSGAEVSERILREQRAGLYLADIHIGGVVRVISQLAPAGALERLDNALLLPEVTNPQVWWKSELPWIPGEKDHIVLNFSAYVQEATVINTQLVKPGEIASERDLLNPKWKGKIVMNDASTPSSASAWFSRVVEKLGADHMRELAKQDVVVLRNERLILDWLAHGKYAIGIGIKYENTLDFIEAGAPLDQIGTPETQWVTPGAGTLSLLRNAPRPNVSKLFINWLLSKEGQTVYCIAAGEQSARVDVPTGHLRPKSVRQPGQKYAEDTVETIKKRDYYMNLAKEIFGTVGTTR